MLHMSRFVITLTLGLLMGLFLFTTSAFAQSAQSSSAHVSAQTATVAVSATNVLPQSSYGRGYRYGGYRLVWCQVCRTLRTRIITRACSWYRGCRWSTTWIRSRSCTRVKELRYYGGYRYSDDYRHGGYRFGDGYRFGGYRHGGYGYGDRYRGSSWFARH